MLIIFHYKSIYDFPHFADGVCEQYRLGVPTLTNEVAKILKILVLYSFDRMFTASAANFYCIFEPFLVDVYQDRQVYYFIIVILYINKW